MGALKLDTANQEMFDKCLARFKEVFPHLEIPPIIWNKRMRTSGGKVFSIRAQARCIRMELNPHIVNTPERIEFVLMHELGHVAEVQLFAEGGHGQTWKHCMSMLGADAKRTHDYDVSHLARRKGRIKAKCKCDTHMLTKYRVKKIQSGKSRLVCRSCKSVLVPCQTV